MDQKPKRYRQISLFESFSACKKLKSDNNSMEEGTGSAELFPAAEEEITPSQSDPCEPTDVCQAAEESVVIKSESCEAEAPEFSGDLFPSDPSIAQSLPDSSHSAELFQDAPIPDSQSSSESSEHEPSSGELDGMAVLNRTPNCSLPLPKLEPSTHHSIMFSPHIRPGDAPRPYPSSYRDLWDFEHVRMPCSPQNKIVVENMLGEKRLASRWELICRSLRRDIQSSNELEEAIMEYNSQYKGKWSFHGLHSFINKHLDEAERDHFFESMLPAMIEMALNLPNICTQAVPLLKSGKDHSVTMSQKQIGCLLLNAFFCTFPRRTQPNRHNKDRRTCEYSNYPDINFNRLFEGIKYEKLKCLFNYFSRIISQEPPGTMTFHRQCLPSYKLPIWHTSTRGIRTSVIRSSGLIETDGEGMLQVDFANKFVGGGVLGYGCVQEEIRFMICPELIISRLFVECLDKNEALIVTGVEQYNKYSGYADSFEWKGDFRDETPRDSWGRRYTQLLAIDAIFFAKSTDQFKFECIKRELNKAFCGFYEHTPPAHLPAIATGNWGCGAFNGNPHLKFLIQLMAASEAGRSLVYFTFGDKKLKAEIQEMYEFLGDKNLTIGDMWRLITSFEHNVRLSKKKKPDIYDFIYSQFIVKTENSSQQDDRNDMDQVLDDSDKLAIDKLFEDIAFGGSSTEIEEGT